MSDQPTDQKAINRKMIEDFRTTREKDGIPMNGRPMLLLTTTGAKSGKQRTTPMMKIEDGGQLLVVASNAGAPADPDWYRNLVANPQVTVEAGPDTFDAVAHVATGAEHDQLWDNIVSRYPFFKDHQAKITRQIPVIVLGRTSDKQ